MKKIITYLFLSIIFTGCVSINNSRLPSGIKFQVFPDGTCSYTFTSIKYQDDVDKGRNPVEFFENCAIPGLICKSASLDIKNKSISLVVDEPISKDQLILLCDRNARIYGLLPYWEEYLTQEKKDNNYIDNLFQKVYEEDCDDLYPNDSNIYWIEIVNTENVDNNKTKINLFYRQLSNNKEGQGKSISFNIHHNKGEFKTKIQSKQKHKDEIKMDIASRTNLDIQLDKGKKGKLCLNRKTAYCMCHDYYMLRLFIDDKFVWEKEIGFHSNFSVAIADLDRDGTDEIILMTESGFLQIYKRKTL